MDDKLAERVRAAAAAGWRTILIAAVGLTISWAFWLAIMATRPSWLRALWASHELTWRDMQIIWLSVIGAMKALLLMAVWVVIWLTLWARRLRPAEPQ